MARRASERLLGRVVLLVLRLLGGLPEEEVRADRGAQDRDEQAEVIDPEVQVGDEPGHDASPFHVHREHGRDVREDQGSRGAGQIAR